MAPSPSPRGSGHGRPSQKQCPPLAPACRLGCCVAARYTARWSHEAEFSRILIGPKMLTDHMPDVLMRALDSVVADRGVCVSCPPQGLPDVHVV